MKRTLAIFLTLLLLLPLAGCKEAKNYGIDEKKIQRQLEKDGYAITKLKDVPDSVIDNGTIIWTFDVERPLTEQEICENYVDFIAKCHLVKKRDIFRVDHPGSNNRGFPDYYDLYTMKIEKLFYTAGTEKEGDIISIWGGELASKENKKGTLNFATVQGSVLPPEGLTFYIFARNAKNENDPEYLSAMWEISPLVYSLYNILVIQIKEGEYELHSSMESLTANAEARPGTIYPKGTNIFLKTDDMDERVQAMVDKYKK